MGLAVPALGALVAIVRDPAGAVLPADDVGTERLVDLAIEHRVPRALADALRGAGREVPDSLSTALDVGRVRHLRSLRALAGAGAALDAAGLPWAVVKGPVLATRWHDDPTARPYDDLDLLVPPDALRDAVEVLRSVGFEHRNRNWEGFRSLGVGEVPLDDGTTVIDLHWHLIGLTRHRRDFRIPTRELIDRAVDVQLGGVSARTLDDADALVHLCLHHALSGSRRLGQLRDVLVVATAVPPDGGIDRLRTARATRLAAAVIDRAERALGPIDARGLTAAALGRPSWTIANRWVDAAWARLDPSRSGSFPGALLASGRDSVGGTFRALGERVVHSTRTKLGLTSVVSDGGPLDWNHSSGGSAERERFFADVAAGRYGR